MDRSLASSSPRTAGRLGPARSARLDLTPVSWSHRDSLARVFAKEEVWRFPFGRGLTRDETTAFVESQVEHWETLGFGLWVATVRGRDEPIEPVEPIGFVGLSVPGFLPEVLPAVEVGWRLDPDAWGHGYATEAAQVALARAFGSLGLDQVISLPQIDNTASMKVAERIGMRLERGTTAPATERRGPVEVAVMVMTRHEWREESPGPTGGGVRLWRMYGSVSGSATSGEGRRPISITRPWTRTASWPRSQPRRSGPRMRAGRSQLSWRLWESTQRRLPRRRTQCGRREVPGIAIGS